VFEDDVFPDHTEPSVLRGAGSDEIDHELEGQVKLAVNPIGLVALLIGAVDRADDLVETGPGHFVAKTSLRICGH
jgi:hypothetical protein